MHHIVSKFRKFAKYIYNSPKVKEKLNSLKSNNRDTIHIALYLRTCWNSDLEMLGIVLKLKSVIMSLVHYLKIVGGRKEFNYKHLPDLSKKGFVLIEGLCLILQPFKNVT